MLQIISIPLGWIMSRIYEFVGNYGVTLIIFTFVTKMIMLPLTINQKKSMIRMNAFQPLINNIQKKYANDPAKQQEELARLQKEHNAEAQRWLEERRVAEQRTYFIKMNLCQHCGGTFSGLFSKKCSVCGKPKDYK